MFIIRKKPIITKVRVSVILLLIVYITIILFKARSFIYVYFSRLFKIRNSLNIFARLITYCI